MTRDDKNLLKGGETVWKVTRGVFKTFVKTPDTRGFWHAYVASPTGKITSVHHEDLFLSEKTAKQSSDYLIKRYVKDYIGASLICNPVFTNRECKAYPEACNKVIDMVTKIIQEANDKLLELENIEFKL